MFHVDILGDVSFWGTSLIYLQKDSCTVVGAFFPRGTRLEQTLALVLQDFYRETRPPKQARHTFIRNTAVCFCVGKRNTETAGVAPKSRTPVQAHGEIRSPRGSPLALRACRCPTAPAAAWPSGRARPMGFSSEKRIGTVLLAVVNRPWVKNQIVPPVSIPIPTKID